MIRPKTILQADRVSVSLDGNPVLHEIDFAIPSGSFVGIIGPNGSGKTTLLRAAGRLIGYHGSLLLEGSQISGWDRARFASTVAFVRPASPLAFDFLVFDLVMLGRSPQKKWLHRFDADDAAVVRDALESVDLSGFDRRSIHTLSSGEQQRVFLAQAMAQDPEVLLLDEPTAHLDIHHRFAFLNRVRAFVSRGGTAIAALHDIDLACRFADLLLVLNHGKVVGFGQPGRVVTEQMFEEVFHVRAEVIGSGDKVENIRYHGSVQVTPVQHLA